MKRAFHSAAWAAFLVWCLIAACGAMLFGRSARDLLEDVQ